LYTRKNPIAVAVCISGTDILWITAVTALLTSQKTAVGLPTQWNMPDRMGLTLSILLHICDNYLSGFVNGSFAESVVL